ncbi:MAG: Hsp20/alpha crystallin family protein [Spirochaeta sp.]|nr:Hsp20/alpha crystallin family protein [Spirochaeta sp.]
MQQNILEKSRTLENVRTVRPVGNIVKEEGKVVLKLEMPGVTKENVELKIENDQLIVQGKRHTEEGDVRFVLRERPFGDYFQSFTLEDTVDRDQVEAAMEQGVLTVTLNLKESHKPRKIQING